MVQLWDVSQHTYMKLNFKAGFAVFLGILTAAYIFHLAHWSYHPFDDAFDAWKATVAFGLPIVNTMIWLWFIEMAFKPRSK